MATTASEICVIEAGEEEEAWLDVGWMGMGKGGGLCGGLKLCYPEYAPRYPRYLRYGEQGISRADGRVEEGERGERGSHKQMACKVISNKTKRDARRRR